jgi:hypothetical protein
VFDVLDWLGRYGPWLIAAAVVVLFEWEHIAPWLRHPFRARAMAKLRQAALPLGTELRDIRHKIELVMSTRPHPHYSHGFRLPGARWDEYDAFLAKDWPDLYPVIERAYTAAHHVNEALKMRETRAGGTTIGVIPDDGLAEAYEAAGVALDALGEPRGEPWETGAQVAVRTVTEDILREWDQKKQQQPPAAA